MNFPPTKYPGYLETGVMAIASLTDLPKQPANLNPQGSFLNTQIQQIRTTAAPPVVDSQAPLQVTRRAIGGGVFQYRVQFIAPTNAQDPNYQATTISLGAADGTVRLAASGGAGPIVFNSTKIRTSSSVIVEQNNTNSSSETNLGNGNSRAIAEL